MQLAAGTVMFGGALAEVATGEGKSLIASFCITRSKRVTLPYARFAYRAYRVTQKDAFRSSC
ncbi:MAG: hypothetical protein ACK55I_28410 [bacterium]